MTLWSGAKYGVCVAELVWRYCELLAQAVAVHCINNCMVLGKYYRSLQRLQRLLRSSALFLGSSHKGPGQTVVWPELVYTLG